MGDDQLYFGYFRLGDDQKSRIENIKTEFAKGHLNTTVIDLKTDCLSDALESLRLLKEFGCTAWLSIASNVFRFSKFPIVLIDQWENTLKGLMGEIEKANLMDAVLGFFFDEPMLHSIKKDLFRDVTKYLRETYPSLRVYACFATNAIEPTVWSNNGNDQVLDPDTTQYLTDAGYDMYWDVRDIDVRENKEEGGIEPYQKVNASLKARLGRDDVKIWYVPCIMSYFGKGDEEYALAHLHAMYDFLKGEKNPGGLICYTYDSFNNDGIGNIGYREKQAQWTTLESELVRIGKEIRAKNK